MARSFNGTTDWYGTVSKQNPQTALTYSIWVNPTTATPGQIMMASYAGGTNTTVFSQFAFTAGVLDFRILQALGAPSTFIGRTSSNVVTAGTWQHVAGVWTGGTTAAAIKIYYNGTQVDTADDISGIFTAPSNANIPTYIAAQNSNTVGSPVWQAGYGGSLADVAIWSVALTASETLALAKGARPGQIRPLSLFAWPPFEGSQTVEPDLSGNVNNATIITGGPTLAPGPPVMMFTPRWPLGAILPISAPFTLMPQIVM